MKQQIVLELNANDKKVLVGGGLVIGLILGLLSTPIWSVLKKIDWLPFYGPINSLMSIDGSWTIAVRTIVLALIGLIIALIIVHTSPKVIVSKDEIEIGKAGDTRVIKRSQIAGVYLKGSKLIIEAPEGRRLYDGDVEGGKQKVADAFKEYGYPWESQ